jgi:hypothetical protein
MTSRTPLVPISLTDPSPLFTFSQDLENLLRHRDWTFFQILDGTSFNNFGLAESCRIGRGRWSCEKISELLVVDLEEGDAK